jgi:ubiquinone/menaquinone biosynthesis C-methylase UbiE
MSEGRTAQLAYSEQKPLMSDEAHRRQKARKIVGVLLQHLGREDLGGLTVLDLGCSAGIIASELAARGGRTVGVDIDAPGLARAQREHGETVRFLAADGEQLPFPDGSVDVVVFNHIYEHVVAAEPVVEEIQRVLAPTGVVYLGLGNRLGVIEPHYRLPFLSYLPAGPADRYVRAFHRAERYHERFRTRRGLRRLFAGLTCWDYSLAIVREPSRFAAADVVHGPLGSAVSALPTPVLSALLPVFPTYVWVGGKSAAGPRGAVLGTPVRRVT